MRRRRPARAKAVPAPVCRPAAREAEAQAKAAETAKANVAAAPEAEAQVAAEKPAPDTSGLNCPSYDCVGLVPGEEPFEAAMALYYFFVDSKWLRAGALGRR